MPRERDNSLDQSSDNMYKREQIRYQWMLESLQKFRIFFAGLVFAILSFSIQFSITSSQSPIKCFQIISWISLLGTGVLAIKDAGGFVSKYPEKSFEGLSEQWRIFMWGLFVVAMVLLILTRIIPNNAT